jgi:hypothetical protein
MVTATRKAPKVELRCILTEVYDDIGREEGGLN